MNQQHHFTGLTDSQVVESRNKYGINILTPPEKETLWDKLKESCTHWIAISMFVLIAGQRIIPVGGGNVKRIVLPV